MRDEGVVRVRANTRTRCRPCAPYARLGVGAARRVATRVRARADNEVIFDSWTHPWEAELGDIAMATFVQAGASADTIGYAALAHASLVAQLNATAKGQLPRALAPPLVEYDPGKARAPFRVIEPSVVPMRCDPAAQECWRQQCDAPLFSRMLGSPPPMPPAQPHAPPPAPEETSYEELLASMATARAAAKGNDPKARCTNKGRR